MMMMYVAKWRDRSRADKSNIRARFVSKCNLIRRMREIFIFLMFWLSTSISRSHSLMNFVYSQLLEIDESFAPLNKAYDLCYIVVIAMECWSVSFTAGVSVLRSELSCKQVASEFDTSQASSILTAGLVVQTDTFYDKSLRVRDLSGGAVLLELIMHASLTWSWRIFYEPLIRFSIVKSLGRETFSSSCSAVYE